MNKQFHPLSNAEVDMLLKHVSGFKGTFAKDQFKGKIKELEFGVINIDDSTGPGSHFTAYANIPNHEHVYYYDSYGVIPPKNIERYLKTSGKTIAYNNSQHQLIGSVICGWYCISFIMNMQHGISFFDFLNMFTDNHELNDKNIMKMAKQRFSSFFK